MRFIVAVATVLVLFVPSQASAHPGGTDASGCHRESSTGVRHCHGTGGGSGGGSGGGLGPIDPGVLYGFGYGFTGLGAMFTLIGFAGEGHLNDIFHYSFVLYGGSELLAIISYAALAGDPVHFGVITGLNVVGAIASVVGLAVHAPRNATAPAPSYSVVTGTGSIVLAGVF